MMVGEGELIEAIEGIVPSAKHLHNFWVGRRVVCEIEGKLSDEPEVFEWRVEDTRCPTRKELLTIILLKKVIE